jgi:hypothetical protein
MFLFAALLCAVPFHSALAQSAPLAAAPDLGAAADFAVLAGTAVTCSSATIVGDVGVNIGGSVSACTVVGDIHVGDALAIQAYSDFLTAYTVMASLPCDFTVTGTLAGQVLTPGVYCIDNSAKTGTLVLDDLGDPNAVWIFKSNEGGIGHLAANSFNVVMAGGAPACGVAGARVFWWANDYATLTDVNFIGTVLAGTSATVTNGNFVGQILAHLAATLTTPATFVLCGSGSGAPCPPITVGPATLPNGTENVLYNQALWATGGLAPYSFAVTTGSLPAGLALSSDGVLSGQPIDGGTYNFTVTATDSNACAGTRDYVLVINPAICGTITIWPSPLPSGTVGVDYLQVFGATGGIEPYTFALASGVLPPGLMLSPHGFIAGIPTLAGTYVFTIIATGDHACTGSQLYALVINPPVCPTILLAPVPLPSGTAGVPYVQAISATGGLAPYSFAVASGILPIGLSLSSNGVLSGIPTVPGTSNFMVTATDMNGCTGSQLYAFVINPPACPTIMVAPSPLPTGTVGVPYSQVISATGGVAPYTFAVASGSLPVGLTLSNHGVLSGIPTVAGTSSVTLVATDMNGCTGIQLYAFVINPAVCPTVLLAPSLLPSGTVGIPYSEVISATGGVGPYTFALASGSLPVGLTISALGVLSGTPTMGGTSSFTLIATDANGCTGSQLYALVINPPACPVIALAPSPLPNGTVGVPYNQVLSASGGVAPYTFAVASGSLPVGVTLTSVGVLSGTPTVQWTSTFTLIATDANGCTGIQAYTLLMTCPTIALSPASLAQGTFGVAYNQTITASGGTGPYTFAVTSGGLPPGLILSSAGALSGIPTLLGTYAFTVTATDTNLCTGSRAYSLVIGCPTITLSPSSLPSGVTGLAYSQTITASGGTGLYTFAVTSGALPMGLTLFSSGILTGTPAAAGTFNFTVTATDANGCAGIRAYALVILCPAIALSPVSFPVGTVGLAWSQTITASGGNGPYAFAVTSGSLPPGLTLSSGGLLSGTPTTAGIFSITVTATDANGCNGSRAYMLTMVNPPLVLHMTTTGPCVRPFKIFVKGSNLQSGIQVFIDGVPWYAVAWKSTGKIVLKGGIHAAVPPGGYHTFTFVNPDGGVATKTWRYVFPTKPCGS